MWFSGSVKRRKLIEGEKTGPLGYETGPLNYPYELKTGPLMPGPSQETGPLTIGG